jgi:hypothetical protein
MEYNGFQIQAARNLAIQEFDKSRKFATELPLKVGDVVMDSFRRPCVIYSIEEEGILLQSARKDASGLYAGLFKHHEVRLATPREIVEIMSYEKPVKIKKTKKSKRA